MNLRDLHIDDSWTLFLDRDGVINKKITEGYVTSLKEFEILPGVLDSIRKLTTIFGRLIIVTNQQGIGKGLMTKADLHKIHRYLSETVMEAGGKIHAIYFAPNLAEEKSEMRKPGTGMALEAKKDFPEIEFSKSIMLGDSLIDMEFGRRAGMVTVFSEQKKGRGNINSDFTVNSLSDFCNTLAGAG